MPQKKIRIGNLLFPKKTILKIIAIFLLITIVDNVVLRYFHITSIVFIIPVNLVLLMGLLWNIKKEVTEIKS